MQTSTLPNPTAPTLTPALTHLHRARHLEPNPLHATQPEVLRYVSRLQQADRALAPHATNTAFPPAEAALLQRRRHSIDAAIARQAALAARRLGSHRHASIATLNAIFDLGAAPHPPMSGDYRGDLLTYTLLSPLDACGRFLARFWLPWKGKHFDPATSTGCNYFTPGGHLASRLTWPLYKHATPTHPPGGLYRYFNFNTSYAPAIDAPTVTALKIDYNLPENPTFLVRSVLDELTQISGGYYLGKAYLRSRRGNHRLAAFFALHAEQVL